VSVYPHLDTIQDPAARTATKLLFDRLGKLEVTIQASRTLTSPTATVTGNQQRVINLADPTDPTDAVNLRTLRSQIQITFNRALIQLGVSRQSQHPTGA
jgi:hypothetical protein